MGNGSLFCIGLDPWLGNGQEHILPDEVRALLDENNIHFLSQVANRNSTNLWLEGWKNWQQLHLPIELADHWDKYTGDMVNSHIRLSETMWIRGDILQILDTYG